MSYRYRASPQLNPLHIFFEDKNFVVRPRLHTERGWQWNVQLIINTTIKNRIGPHQDQEVESFYLFYHQLTTINLHPSIPQYHSFCPMVVFNDDALLFQLPPLPARHTYILTMKWAWERLLSGAPSSQLSLQDYGLQEILNGRSVQNRAVFVVDDATVAFISSVVDNTWKYYERLGNESKSAWVLRPGPLH